MIQILGIRTYKRDGKIQKKEDLFDKNWRAPSVSDLFKNIEQYIDMIPEGERYNLFYTAARCEEKRGRILIDQCIIPFDVDGVDSSRIEEYIEPVLFCLGDVSREEVGIVFSGNGLQFIVETTELITSSEYFNESRYYYKTICSKINAELKKMNLPGDADPSVWSPARLLRLPLTQNIKTPETGYANKNLIKSATLHTRMILPKEGFTVERVAGVETVRPEDEIHQESLKKYPPPDSHTVLSECAFLQYCSTNQEELSEENWYKMLSIVCRLDNAYELAHQMSQYHHGYNEVETNLKLEQAKKASGPRTCANIGTSFDGCHKCEHNVMSPILLKSKDYISTQTVGFRKIKSVTKEGRVQKGSVEYDDLLKYFCQCHDYIVTPERLLYIWHESHWQYTPDSYIDSFTEDNVTDPSPKNNECSEFKAKIFRNYIQTKDWFHDTTFRKINLANGILDLGGKLPAFKEHSKDYGFTYVMPYEYDPDADSPLFDQFMEDVTCQDKEISDLLMEFAGYALANENCTLAKSLLLVGDGANGKSTFMDILKELVGDDAYTGVGLNDLSNEQNRAFLEGKLFNLVEEAPQRAFLDSHNFKNIVSGGTITVKKVFKEPYCIKNRCKIIMACNDLPTSGDMSEGFLRRLLIVPFDRYFNEDERDIHIIEKLREELPGILNKIIEGHQRLKVNGNFTKAEKVKKEIEDFEEENDLILCFLNDSLEQGDLELDFVKTSELYIKFTDYCRASNIRNIPIRNTFGKIVAKKLSKTQFKYSRGQVGKKRDRGFKGIRLLVDHINY